MGYDLTGFLPPYRPPARQLERLLLERWICKTCADTVRVAPYLGIGAGHERCPSCGGRDWHYTTAPAPRV